MAQNISRIVRNRSSRGGVKPRLVVLHTTEGKNAEGIRDLVGLATWFDNPAAQASSHRGVDAEGNSVLMVADDQKAWTCASYNAVSLNIEQVGFASTSEHLWFTNYLPGLLETARIVAVWSRRHGIPIRKGRVLAGRVVISGVVQHSQLGPLGGGHHDCGPGYPDGWVRRAARYYRATWDGKKKTADSLRKLLDRDARKHGKHFVP